uniref:CACTA en-spm transposon protein n=1 Tax=Cucumis melo TaxID=3656 RepID=A0A9I9EIP7_CUCME
MQEQSRINKIVRQKQPYNHSSGSKSFLQRQHELFEQREELIDHVELFQQTHIRDGTFVSQAAEDAHGPKPKARKMTSASSSTTSCPQSIVELQLQNPLCRMDEAR